MYIAYYGRPGDPSGVEYWAQRLDVYGGNSSAIVDSFGNSTEYIDNYGHFDNDVLVNNLYQQLFGRDADYGGLQFYVGLLRSETKSLASIALSIANGAKGEDVNRLNSRLNVAQSFTEGVAVREDAAGSGAIYGESQLTDVKAAMSQITDDPNSILEANAKLESILMDDFYSTSYTNGTISVDSWENGVIGTSNDQDWFYVELQAGHTYQIDLRGKDSNLGTLTDPFVTLYDWYGNIIDSDDDSGDRIEAQLTYTAVASDGYYIAASSTLGYTGTYDLELTDLSPQPTDDYSSDTDTSGWISVGGWTNGTIEAANDQDWFFVELQGGVTYQVDLRGESSDYGTLHDPIVYLYDWSGDIITGDDDSGSGLDSQLIYTPYFSDYYYIGASDVSTGIGTYDLQVIPLDSGFDDYPADTSSWGWVDVGGSTSGDIETAYDEDWFLVYFEADVTYGINLLGEDYGYGSLVDPYVTLYDEYGDFIASDDDSSGGYDSYLSYTPYYDGYYWVAASGFAESTGTYDVSVSYLIFD